MKMNKLIIIAILLFIVVARKIKIKKLSKTKVNISVPNDLPISRALNQGIAGWFNLIKFSLSTISWRRSTVTKNAQVTPPGDLTHPVALNTIINNYRDGNANAWPANYFPKSYNNAYVINSVQPVANEIVNGMDAGRIPTLLNENRWDRRWTAGRAMANYEILRQKDILWNIFNMGDVDSNDLIKMRHLTGQFVIEDPVGIFTISGCTAFLIPGQSVKNTQTEVFIGSISHCFIGENFDNMRFVPYGLATDVGTNAFHITKITKRDGTTINNNSQLAAYIDTMRGTYAQGYVADDYLKISISTTAVGGGRIETILSPDIINGTNLKSLQENEIDEVTDSLSLFAFGTPANVFQQSNGFTLVMDVKGEDKYSPPTLIEPIYLVQPTYSNSANTLLNTDTGPVHLTDKVATTLATSGGFSGCPILKCGLETNNVKCIILGANESSQLVTNSATGTRGEYMNVFAKKFN